MSEKDYLEFLKNYDKWTQLAYDVGKKYWEILTDEDNYFQLANKEHKLAGHKNDFSEVDRRMDINFSDTGVYFGWDCFYGDRYFSMPIYYLYSPEKLDEFKQALLDNKANLRIERELADKLRKEEIEKGQEALELAQYERLKKKFESNG